MCSRLICHLLLILCSSCFFVLEEETFPFIHHSPLLSHLSQGLFLKCFVSFSVVLYFLLPYCAFLKEVDEKRKYMSSKYSNKIVNWIFPVEVNNIFYIFLFDLIKAICKLLLEQGAVTKVAKHLQY